MTDRDKKDRDNIIKEKRQSSVAREVSKLIDRGAINFEALTGLHTYCEALIELYTQMKDELRNLGVRSGSELDEIKKMIKKAEICQDFIEALYKEDLEMKGIEVVSGARYLWCDKDEWEELVKSWRQYIYVRSYGTDRVERD